MLTERSTLAQFLFEERRSHPGSSGELNSLILDVALACKAIALRIGSGAVSGVSGKAGAVAVQDERLEELGTVANDVFLRATEWGGQVAGITSVKLAQPYLIPEQYPRGKYLLTLDPLEGSSNIDVNQSAGSIFSILLAPVAGADARPDDFLQRGSGQVAAGYAIYGPSTVLVLTVGTGVHAFTLDPSLGEFILTRQDIRLPEGPRQKDVHVRSATSLVAETHRILTRGGVFLDLDIEDPPPADRLRVLHEANPVAFLIEQAGGLATTGRERVLEIRPTELHQRIGFIFGCRDEVERIVRYHAEGADKDDSDSHHNPLYGPRGLFRLTK